MAMYLTDPSLERRLKLERAKTGADRFDEVWEGVYRISPLANNEHMEIVTRLAVALGTVVEIPGLCEVRLGVNVSDREQGWKRNYRVPDLAVMLASGRAKNCETHWCGGPDFIVEVLSPRDRARKKFPFYCKIEVGEVLLIDRRPWALELYWHIDGELREVGKSTLEDPQVLVSKRVPFQFRLQAGATRPVIEVSHVGHDARWSV